MYQNSIVKQELMEIKTEDHLFETEVNHYQHFEKDINNIKREFIEVSGFAVKSDLATHQITHPIKHF